MSLPEFRNEPFVDFSTEANRAAMREALDRVGRQLGKEFPLIIGGQRVHVRDKFRSINPARKTEVIGVCQAAGAVEVEAAIGAAWKAHESWKRVPAEERAAVFLRAADLLRRRKLDAEAWMIYEVGKNWPEADGEVAESIDHLEFFARETLRYARGREMAAYPQEYSIYSYIPLGVVAVISPWNFPLALCMGMTLGALA
ncbi:MAG: aldehyde dehydrogenase family protein, partial [Armatimonadetes bacterium]|nr:aldehyde dehydrogenase family protein [Armatimonadota bacterium]